MLRIKFKGFDGDGYGKAASAVRRVIAKRLLRFSRIIEARLRRDTPVRTGALRRSTERELDIAGPFGRVTILQTAVDSVGFPYGWYVRNGRDPYVIRPRRAQALRFEVNGEVVFAKRVQHPGYEGRPYHKKAKSLGDKLMWSTVIGIEEDLMRIANEKPSE